jgi:hypothetical protein
MFALSTQAFGGWFPSPPLYPSFTSPKAKSKITIFDVPGSFSTTGNHINDVGVIAGYYRYDQNEESKVGAFVRAADGTITTIKVKHSVGAEALALNDSGIVIGTYADDKIFFGHGFVRAVDGTITKFDAPDAGLNSEAGNVGTVPISINKGGVITGNYVNKNGVSHGFVRTVDGTIIEFTSPEAGKKELAGTFPQSINIQGAIVGYSLKNRLHSFLRTADGKMSAIDVPGAGGGAGFGTVAYAINDAGTVAGQYSIYTSASYHGFVRTADGAITKFDAPGSGTAGGQGTYPFSINAAGTIVGYYIDANYLFHGFVRQTNGTVTTIDVPGAGTGQRQGTLTYSINKKGEIAGSYIDGSNAYHSFMRSP